VLAAIEKAEILIEALHWIRQFRGKTTVIKLGGSVMDNRTALDGLLLDIVFMETVGMRPVVVHGGGAAISKAMSEAGLEVRFVQGRRYTCPRTLEIVERILAGEVNDYLAERVAALGGKPAPLNFRTTPVLFGERLTLADKEGQPIDLGFVGQVTRVDVAVIQAHTAAGAIPLIPSMALGPGGEKLNVNADTAATAVAQALQAEKLVFLSDVNGVRRRADDPQSLIPSLSAKDALELIRSGAIEGGMIPKVQACLNILARGVRKVHIIDGRIPHSILLEIYTSQGVGTEIFADETLMSTERPQPVEAVAAQGG